MKSANELDAYTFRYPSGQVKFMLCGGMVVFGGGIVGILWCIFWGFQHGHALDWEVYLVLIAFMLGAYAWVRMLTNAISFRIEVDDQQIMSFERGRRTAAATFSQVASLDSFLQQHGIAYVVRFNDSQQITFSSDIVDCDRLVKILTDRTGLSFA